MRFVKTIRNIVLPAVAFMFLVPSSPVDARGGLYLGAQIPYNMVQGEFDDVHMPEISAGSGVGVLLGYRFEPPYALEVNWSTSIHGSGGATIELEERTLNGKAFLNAPAESQLYVLAGIGTFSLGDSSLTFSGIGYNAGAGFDHYITPELSAGFAFIWKTITYDKITKSDEPMTLVGTIKGDTASFRFDITIHF